jgi:hypothetical protein
MSFSMQALQQQGEAAIAGGNPSLMQSAVDKALASAADIRTTDVELKVGQLKSFCRLKSRSATVARRSGAQEDCNGADRRAHVPHVHDREKAQGLHGICKYGSV